MLELKGKQLSKKRSQAIKYISYLKEENSLIKLSPMKDIEESESEHSDKYDIFR